MSADNIIYVIKHAPDRYAVWEQSASVEPQHSKGSMYRELKTLDEAMERAGVIEDGYMVVEYGVHYIDMSKVGNGMSKPCPMCRERGQTWNGAPPRCAFLDGVFNGDNWNCATANALRDIADEDGWGENNSDRRTWAYRDDLAAASFGVIYVDETDTDPGGGYYVVMSWYKRRGRTGQIYVMNDDMKPRPITLQEAEEVIRHYGVDMSKGEKCW